MNNPTVLTKSGSSSGATSYTTASISPTANALVLVFVSAEGTGVPEPTITGGGMTTWSTVRATSWNSAVNYSKLVRAMQASPGSAQITIDFGGGAVLTRVEWLVVQIVGADTSGTNGDVAVQQNGGSSSGGVTSISTTLGSLIATTSISIGFVHARVLTDIAPLNSFTELDQSSTNGLFSLYVCYLANAVNPGASWTGADNALIAAVEVKAAVTGEMTFPITASADDDARSRDSGGYPPTGGGGSDTTATEQVVRKLSNPFDEVFVGLLRFDTSALPDTATITGAKLRLYVTAVVNADTRSLQGDWHTWTPTPTDSDWIITTGTDALAGTALSALTTSAINELTLANPTTISKTGYSGIRLGISGAEPTGDNRVNYATYDNTTLIEPRLVVTYTEVTVQTAYPSSDSVDGFWTDQADGTTLYAAIDETSPSDTDYIKSDAAPSASGCRVKLGTLTDPLSSTGHSISWRVSKSSGGTTMNMTVKLYQGGANVQGAGTLIATFTRNNVPTGWTTYSETLSGAEADAITDYTDLYLEFFATES